MAIPVLVDLILIKTKLITCCWLLTGQAGVFQPGYLRVLEVLEVGVRGDKYSYLPISWPM